MNIESVREYCLSLPHATEDFPFDETTLAFRIGGRIFAMIDLERTEWFVLKCNPDMAIELREKYAEIAPAWHMNKRHWNQINLFGYLSEELICSLIRHSYSLVVQKLPKAIRLSLKGVTEVEGTVLAE
jgi:predicted DNA-binding protein (MmcQ/YjbR family)